jgi:hypothetical protein
MDVRKRRGAVGAATFLVACAACLLAPGLALAGTLDQQQTSTGGAAFSIGTNQTVAQTFTAGITGTIDEVDLHLGYSVSAPTAPLTVEIRSASGGVPTNTVLASSSIPASSAPASSAFVPVAFASQASVAAGTQYAIVASSATPAITNNYEWTDAPSANPYPGGTALYAPPGSSAWANDTTADVAFKTYVVPSPPVPTPAAGPTGQQGATPKKCKKKRSHQRRRKCKRRASKLRL